MPAKGKHRRPKVNPISRGFVAAGAGGAVVALPLLGATGAHAAEQAAPAQAPQQAVTAAAATPAQAPAAAPAAKAKPRTYSVVAGDYLSKIAAEHHLAGGWKKLYSDNRQVVGGNPSLIFPGMKLTLGAKSTAKAPAPKAAPKAPAKKATAKKASAETRSSRSSERPAVQSTAPAAQSAPSTPSTGSGWVAPVGGGIGTPYRASGSMWSSGYHTGVDFIASSGTSVKAVGPGTVYSAGWSGAYGNEVVIQHADGTYSQYAHLSSLSVSAGQTVAGGDQIGLSGSTGNSSGPHLHFEMRTGPSYGSDIDPLAYLREHGVNV
ncbi:LysM peptidoglycan-binding domain-containing M23 family metallopeptidase [Streptomyces sp. JL2001]|uniref:LysM peptidoglycan-binding domain-containing M23 family metallopeptidase n=1 Tax=Streptomyces sp. JL2001 TaxID=3342488 RepID=UPI003D802260